MFRAPTVLALNCMPLALLVPTSAGKLSTAQEPLGDGCSNPYGVNTKAFWLGSKPTSAGSFAPVAKGEKLVLVRLARLRDGSGLKQEPTAPAVPLPKMG